MRKPKRTWAGVLLVVMVATPIVACLSGRCPDAYDYVEGCGCQEVGFMDPECRARLDPRPSASPSHGDRPDGGVRDASHEDADDVQDARSEDASDAADGESDDAGDAADDAG